MSQVGKLFTYELELTLKQFYNGRTDPLAQNLGSDSTLGEFWFILNTIVYIFPSLFESRHFADYLQNGGNPQ